MYNTLFRSVIFPVMEQYSHTHIQKYYSELEKSQWLPAEKITELQNKKLRHLVEHAYANVPYYRRIFKQKNLLPQDIKSVDDLSKLPFLTKDIIRQNFQDLTARNLTKNAILNHTSGSTGQPLRYYITKDGISISWATGYRGWGWGGYEFGDKRATLGFWRDYDSAATSTSRNIPLLKRLRFTLERNLPLSTFNMTEGVLESYVSKIRNYNPKILRGYPSALSILAHYIEENKVKNIQPKAVFTTAETLFPHQKRKIEEIFQCPTFNHYGCRDGAANAMECEEHSGLHIGSEQCYIEVINNNKKADHSGLGEIISTDFHNYAMPFIRYRTGDCGILSDEECPCGRGLPLLQSIEGRLINVVVHSDGSYLTGLPLTDVFEHLEQIKNDTIRHYQVIQETKECLVIKIVKGKNYCQENDQKIISEMKKHLGETVVVSIEYVDDIPVTQGGKRNYVISHIPKETIK